MKKVLILSFFIFNCVNAMQSGGPHSGPSQEDLLKEELIHQILNNFEKTDRLLQTNQKLEKANTRLQIQHSRKVKFRLTKRQFNTVVLTIGQLFCLDVIFKHPTIQSSSLGSGILQLFLLVYMFINS